MSEARYTKGPWEWRPASRGWHGRVYGADGLIVGIFKVDPNAPDAHLIAAAPSLLEALEAMLALHGTDTDQGTLDEVNAAIAKARGQS